MQGNSLSRHWWHPTRGVHIFRVILVSLPIALSFWFAVFSTADGGNGSELVVRADRAADRGTAEMVLARAVIRHPENSTPPPPSSMTTMPASSPGLDSTIVEPTRAPSVASAVPAVTTTCADALGYLAVHAAPGFAASCEPGNSMGRFGYTCWNVAPQCGDGGRVIHIACPAPFVYQNEAHNSWALLGQRSGIDPYGQGSPAEQAFCDRYR